MTEARAGSAHPTPKKRPPAALPSRIVAGGAALGLGLALVGGMAAGADSATAPAPSERIVRVVVDEDVMDGNPTAARSGSTVVPELPRSEPRAERGQAPVTESGGS